MGVDPELRALMTNKVRLSRKQGKADRFGNDVYSPPIEALCRIDGRTREVIKQDGSKTGALGRVFLADIYPWLTEETNLHVPSIVPEHKGWMWAEIVGIDLLYDENGDPYCQVLSYGEH